MDARVHQNHAYGMPEWHGHKTLPFNLVLEGGAMRGVFTAGVLDFFMKEKIFAELVIGVSAGALIGYNYVAGAIGRNYQIFNDYFNDPRFMSANNFVKTGSIMNGDFLFHTIPEAIDPFDARMLYHSPMKLISVATDLETGDADYHVCDGTDPEADNRHIIASSSIPFLSKAVEVNGKLLLDGSTSDSIPIHYSRHLGNTDKHVVIHTRPSSFVKSQNPAYLMAKSTYKDYPQYCARMKSRNDEFNQVYRDIEAMEARGEIFVLEPKGTIEVKSLEKDMDKVNDLYRQGFEVAEQRKDDLLAYLES